MTDRVGSTPQSRIPIKGNNKDSQSRTNSLERRKNQCLERARLLRKNNIQSHRLSRSSPISVVRSIFIPKEREGSQVDYFSDHKSEVHEGTTMIIDEDSGAGTMHRNDLYDEETPEDELVALCGGWDQYQELLSEIELELLSETPPDESDELAAGELYYTLDSVSPCEYDLHDEENTMQCTFCEGLMRVMDNESIPCMKCSMCNIILPLVHPYHPHESISVNQLKDLLARSLERHRLACDHEYHARNMHFLLNSASLYCVCKACGESSSIFDT